MKKRILSVLLALTLVFAYAVPVAATDNAATAPNAATVAEDVVVEQTDVEPNGNVFTVSDDPDVQAAFDAYMALADALEAKEYGPLKDAYDQLYSITNAFTDEQDDEWSEIVSVEIGLGTCLDTVFDAAYVIDAVTKCEAYIANPDVATALDFVAAYDECLEMEIEINAFYPNIEESYTSALNVLPAQHIMDVYWAYVDVADFLNNYHYYDTDFIAVCEAFEAQLDTFNELSEAELAELAVVMGLETAGEAWNQIFSDWANASTILEIGETVLAFDSNPTVKTATAFIEVYERVFLTEGFFTAADRALFEDFSYGVNGTLEDQYEAAKELVANGENAGTTSETEENDKSDKDDSPATGDDFNVAPFAALLMISAAVAGLAVRRRNVQ